MQSGLGLIGGIGIVFYLLMMLGMIVGYIFLIIAIWRGMKAHESIAETLENYLRVKQTNSYTFHEKKEMIDV